MIRRIFASIIRLLAILGFVALVFAVVGGVWLYITLNTDVVGVNGQAPNRLPLDFPDIQFTGTDGRTPGHVFFENVDVLSLIDGAFIGFPGSYSIQLDTRTGEIAFARKNLVTSLDFKRLSDDLMVIYLVDLDSYYPQTVIDALQAGVGFKSGRYVLLNNDYDVVGEIPSTKIDGYGLDFHEFILLSNGNYAYYEHVLEEMDYPEQGCPAPCPILSQTIVELSPDLEVVNTFPLSDYYTLPQLTDNYELAPEEQWIDLIHANAIHETPEGDLLISVRQFSEVMLIDYETREPVWRLGGTNSPLNEFEILDDPQNGFSAQHTATLLENGNVLIFDNGNTNADQVSRAVEYELDLEAMTARLVWSHTREDNMFTPNRGSAYRLSSGNTLINWVTTAPHIQEVTPDGEVVMEISLPEPFSIYRANFWEIDS